MSCCLFHVYVCERVRVCVCVQVRECMDTLILRVELDVFIP